MIIATTVAATLPIINPTSVFAAEVTYATEADANTAGFTFSLNGNGKYTITDYTGSNTTVSIPSKIQGGDVTGISNEAFNSKYRILSITIPNSITSIGRYAFFNCSGLTNSNSDFNDEIGTGNTYTLTSSDGNKYIGVSAKVDSVSFKAVIGKILNDTSNTNSSGSEIILSKGSLGIAGDGKVTGLASKRKYTVRANGITYYVKADGTLSLKKSDCDYLIGTEITGLTNGTAYYVERYSTRRSTPTHKSDPVPLKDPIIVYPLTNTETKPAASTESTDEPGWTKDSKGNWFFISADGSKAKGWNRVNGYWYFFDNNTGVMLTGWQYIDNNWYYFNTSGAMESDSVVDGYTLGSNGALI